MVHGLKQNRVDTNYGSDKVAHDLVAHGYAVLLFDLRACGESGGTASPWRTASTWTCWARMTS